MYYLEDEVLPEEPAPKFLLELELELPLPFEPFEPKPELIPEEEPIEPPAEPVDLDEPELELPPFEPLELEPLDPELPDELRVHADRSHTVELVDVDGLAALQDRQVRYGLAGEAAGSAISSNTEAGAASTTTSFF